MTDQKPPRVNWAAMSNEEMAAILYQAYCSPEYDGRPGQLKDMHDGKGRVWRWQNVSFLALGGRMTGLGRSRLRKVYDILVAQGLALSQGEAGGTTYYVRVVPAEPS